MLLISHSLLLNHFSKIHFCINFQIKSYYGISRNLLIRFKDDTIDETPALAQVLGSGSAISSMLDMSIRLLPGDHGLPLQQVSAKDNWNEQTIEFFFVPNSLC